MSAEEIEKIANKFVDDVIPFIKSGHTVILSVIDDKELLQPILSQSRELECSELDQPFDEYNVFISNCKFKGKQIPIVIVSYNTEGLEISLVDADNEDALRRTLYDMVISGKLYESYDLFRMYLLSVYHSLHDNEAFAMVYQKFYDDNKINARVLIDTGIFIYIVVADVNKLKDMFNYDFKPHGIYAIVPDINDIDNSNKRIILELTEEELEMNIKSMYDIIVEMVPVISDGMILKARESLKGE